MGTGEAAKAGTFALPVEIPGMHHARTDATASPANTAEPPRARARAGRARARARVRALALAIAAGLALPPGTAAADGTSECAGQLSQADHAAGHLYLFCGYYWAPINLPIEVVLNPAGAPAALGGSLTAATEAAILQWDPTAALGCARAAILCFDGTGGATVLFDFRSTISFSSPGSCDSMATPTWWRPTHSPQRLGDVDVVINASCPLFHGLPADPAQAAKHGPSTALAGMCGTPTLCATGAYDLQGVLAIAVGYILGLGTWDGTEPLDAGTCWPGDIFDPDHQHVMYFCSYPGALNKRVLWPGDRAGLARVLAESAQHPLG